MIGYLRGLYRDVAACHRDIKIWLGIRVATLVAISVVMVVASVH